MDGKRILVVGGNSGIGLSLVNRLAEKGNEVVVASRTLGRLDIDHCKQNNISHYCLDASCEVAVKRMFEELGSLDGIVSTIKPKHLVCDFLQTEVDDAKLAFEAKFWGQYHLCRYGAHNLKEEGVIVLSSGIAASKAFKGFSSTSAMNGAIESLVRALALELAPLRVNAVSPGFVERFPNDTERLEKVNAVSTGQILLNKLASHNDIVDAYEFMLNNRYTTGTVLTVDGGVLAV